MTDNQNQTTKEVEELDQKGSNSSVMDLSIGEKDQEETTDTKKEKEESSNNFLNRSFDEKTNFFKHFILKYDFENLLDLSEDEECRQRSNTFFHIATKVP